MHGDGVGLGCRRWITRGRAFAGSKQQAVGGRLEWVSGFAV